MSIKVCIATTKGSWSCSSTGKGFFMARLIPEFENLGVKVTTKPDDKSDIHVGIGKFLYKPKSGKRVLRLGPCHFNKKEDWKTLNKRKSDAVRKADGVIYQSQWSKKVCNKYLGRNEVEAVIFNGSPIQKKHTSHPNYFVALTRTWLPQKRLKTIIRAFKMAEIQGAVLYVFGNVKKKVDFDEHGDVKIIYEGLVDRQRLSFILNLCNTLVHPVYLDCAPNAIVEALCAGCRVITTDQGGTRELVKDNGIILKDKPWDFKPINLDKPPKLSIERLAEAMCMEAVDGRPVVDASHVDIRNIAKQYKGFFERVLDA